MSFRSRQDLLAHPDRFRAVMYLPTCEAVELRLLGPQDAQALGRYFLSLSAATRRVYAPHPFDLATAVRLCAEADQTQVLRFVAVTGAASSGRDAAVRHAGNAPSEPQVIAYIIVRLTPGSAEVERYAAAGIDLDPETTCYLAPSVADAYQSRGVGSVLMQPILSWLRELGYHRLALSGGVRAENARAKRFYARLGFRHVGDFQTQGQVDNHDMMLALA